MATATPRIFTCRLPDLGRAQAVMAELRQVRRDRLKGLRRARKRAPEHRNQMVRSLDPSGSISTEGSNVALTQPSVTMTSNASIAD